MIGVLFKPGQETSVCELFQLFKTPWEPWRPDRAYDAVIVTRDEMPEIDARLVLVYGAAPRIDSCRGTVVRFGFDLLDEVERLLTTGQPVDSAHRPTVDLHIATLRRAMTDAGITFVEIPPVPAGHRFAVCLTHDIDFVGIRPHKFDHTMWGFVYRSSVGALKSWLRRRLPTARLRETWRALLSLPFVYLGWAKDFWNPFDWYLRVEQGLPATYFLIPFKRRSGERVPGGYTSRRATAYDITDIPEWTRTLGSAGCEIGVHGIDAWHSVEAGRTELDRIAAATGGTAPGIRMHWLLHDRHTARVLEDAGYEYDSTGGYNETVGYRHGTLQVFRPAGARTLLELPLHIQDGALFYPGRLNLTEAAAWDRCSEMMADAKRLGGVLTILWHDRSHAPERFWGDFYVRLVAALRESKAWFGAAGDVVRWFRARREVRFEPCDSQNGAAIRLRGGDRAITPPLIVRVQGPSAIVETPWNGAGVLDVSLDSSVNPSIAKACA
jgi:hypothetical protein